MKMNLRFGYFLLAFLGLFSVVSSVLKCPGVAQYKLSFYGKWSNMTHPDAVPSKGSPMFSPLVGASHSADYSMWKAGMMASKGVQQVAETGNSSFLQSEIMMRMMYNKTVWKLIQQKGGAINGTDHVMDIDVEVTADYPYVSLISMIFPSPDWFIGGDSINLCNDGKWRDTWNVAMLPPWDAGTDSNTTFIADDVKTSPQGNIAVITKTMDTPFRNIKGDIPTMGMLMFQRVNKPMQYTCSGEQKYMLKFEGMWTQQRQPMGYPSNMNPHFSPLIGCTHMYNYKFWSPMTMASKGVQMVAETGNHSTLYNELKNFMKTYSGNIHMIYKADGMSGADETTTMMITASGKYSQASFIAMIAPSPDWFVGVQGLELCGSDGKWMDSVSRNLPAWDAGTDNGMEFTSGNAPTMPQDVVTIITKDSDTVLKGMDPIPEFAKITFTKYTPDTAGSGAQSISAAFGTQLTVAFLAIIRFLY